MKQQSQQPGKVKKEKKYHTDTTGWVFWEGDSEVKIEMPKSGRECSWDQHLWKGREGSRIGQWGVKPMIQSPPEVSANYREF